MERSISEYFYAPSGPKGHRCGYCKSEDANFSQGMRTHCLTVEDYQDLVDRGWRRSGKYCYKPLMTSTCCPLYTISCSATKFCISKSQKGCVKSLNKFLLHGKKKIPISSAPTGMDDEPVKMACSSAYGDDTSSSNPKQKKPVRPGEGADPSKPLCRKAKEIRLERKAKKKISSSCTSASAVTVSDTGNGDYGSNSAGGSNAGSKQPLVSKPVEGMLKKDINPEFLKDVDSRKPLESFLCLPSTTSTSLVPLHTLKIELVRSSPPSSEFKATFAESYALYKKYQMTVHKDKEEKCDQVKYQRFLCTSPLIPKKGQVGWPCDYGSYHLHYRIDGKLVAVGVLDILPKCLSSVYVYFDTDYNFLRLGVYIALREIEMTRKLHICDAKFKYYYMGYYVHSCQKMRYKGNFSPSFLLCPDSYNFMPIETCLPKLDQAKYSRLCDRETIPENVQDWLGNTLVLWNKSVSSFSTLLPKAKIKEEEVKEYARLVGPTVACRMLLYLEI